MANAFKNAQILIGTTPTTLYTCPVGTQAVIHTLQIPNIDAVNEVNITIQVFDSSAVDTKIIANLIPVAVGGAFVLPKPLNLEPNDRVELIASATNRANAFASILEIT